MNVLVSCPNCGQEFPSCFSTVHGETEVSTVGSSTSSEI